MGASCPARSLADSLAVVIVTYGDRRLQVECTLSAASRAGVRRAVLVSNGCDREVVASLRSLSDGRPERCEITVHHLVENTGSAGGFAEGIATALALPGVQFVWLLDDDNSIEPDALDALAVAVDEIGRGGGPLALASLRPDRPYIADFAAGRARTIRPSSFLSFNVLHMIGRPQAGSPGGCPHPEIPYAPYGGLLLNRLAVERAGLPMRELVLYADDTEYTGRLRRCGVPLRLVSNSVVVDQEPSGMAGVREYSRFGQRSWLWMPERRAYFSLRNETYIASRMFRGSIVLLAVNMVIVGSAIALAAVLERRVGRLPLLARAVWDGLRGRLGHGQASSLA